MRKFTMILIAVMILAMASCEKQEIKLPKPNPKDKLIECKKCEGGWDITDPLP